MRTPSVLRQFPLVSCGAAGRCGIPVRAATADGGPSSAVNRRLRIRLLHPPDPVLVTRTGPIFSWPQAASGGEPLTKCLEAGGGETATRPAAPCGSPRPRSIPASSGSGRMLPGSLDPLPIPTGWRDSAPTRCRRTGQRIRPQSPAHSQTLRSTILRVYGTKRYRRTHGN